MQNFALLYISFISVIVHVSGSIPSYIKICSKKTEPNKCLVDNTRRVLDFLAQHDDTDFNIKSLNGLFHEPLYALQASPQLTVSLRNMKIYGVDSFQPRELSIKGKHLHIAGFMKALNYSGDYEMNGRILILPIRGAGKFQIQQIGQELEANVPVRIEERDGKKYYYMAENTGKLIVHSTKRVIWQFDNLFGGDPRLAAEMNLFLNENWQDVFNEVGESMADAGLQIVFRPILNGYFRNIPIDELFSD